MSDALMGFGSWLIHQPWLWLVATIGLYQLMNAGFQKLGQPALLNPVALSATVLVTLLWFLEIPYELYFNGAQVIDLFLGPATVALAIPLYQQLNKLKGLGVAIVTTLLLGLSVSALCTLAIGWLTGAGHPLLLSILPLSITTPVAMGIAEHIGGIPPLTAFIVITTGILGAVIGPGYLYRLGYRDDRVIGIAMGISAHGIGTARSFGISVTAGSFSALAMALSAIISSVLLPIIAQLVTLF